MSVDVTQLVMSKYYINELKAELNRKSDELADRIKTLQRQCPHATIKTDRNYCSGGYDYVSSVTVVKTCTLCDKIVDTYDDPNHRGTHG